MRSLFSADYITDTAESRFSAHTTRYFGLGEQWDESKLTRYPAGNLLFGASHHPHFVLAKDGRSFFKRQGLGQLR
jgi:hypothetical protein